MPSVHALVPAAGPGSRFGQPQPKLFLAIAGQPALFWTLGRLLACPLDRITVALPAGAGDGTAQGLTNDPRVHWITGGETRQESVYRCLRASPGHADDLILVHDGARPAVRPEDVETTIRAARAEGVDGAILGRPVVDTLKWAKGGWVEGTVDREGLFCAETPQVFRRQVLEQALAKAERLGHRGTDEGSLVEAEPGVRIRAVPARYPNPKLTYPGDLELLEALVLSPQSWGR